MNRSILRASFLFLSAIAAPSAFGQATATLPKAETVLEQYVEATGGKAAYEKFKNRVSTGSFELPGANIKGKLTITQAAPNKLVTSTDLGQIGKSSQGTDGETAWEISTFNGERVLDGEEKDASLSQALFNGEINWKERFTKAECVGTEDVNGKPAYKLVLSRKVGKPVTEYYDVASHLMVKQVLTSKSPQGEITIEQYPEDYRKVDGILIPHISRQKVLGQEMLMKIETIKHNVDLPADTFALPEEIKKLKEKKAK